MTPVVSVVVPTYRRVALLRRCLNALLAQDLDAIADAHGEAARPDDRETRRDPSPCVERPLFEVIVVDDGRSEATRTLVEKLGMRTRTPRIRYVRPPARARGPAAARNAGWRAAFGEVIAFTDDDTVPARDWLAAGLRAMRDEDVAAAWGRVTVPLPLRPSDWERNVARLDGAEFLTANVFVRVRVLAHVGGFDERFKRAWREDSDLQFTLLEHGGRIVHVPDAVVLHPVRPARWGVSVALQKNMLFDALLYKKHPRLYRRKIAPGAPLRYYLVVAALAVALAGTAAGHERLAALAGSLWLAFTLAFAVRRLHGTRWTPSHVAEMVVTSAAIPPLAVFWRLAGAWRFRVLFV